MYRYKLSVEERDQLFEQLSPEQQEFLKQQLVRGKRTAFANAMAKEKGLSIPPDASFEDIEFLLDDWVYVGYIDAGEVTPLLRCECGRPLRYQHIVENKRTGEVKKFGITHLQEHLNIDAKTVDAVKKGIDAVDYELDEVLIKIQRNWQPDPDLINHPDLPEEAKIMLDLNLPLLDRHIRRLYHQRSMIINMNEKELNHKPEMDSLLFDNASEGQRQTEDLLDPLVLPVEFHDPVRKYLAEGIKSARIICELLIEKHGAPNKRFKSGRPKIYVPVCIFIERDNPGVKVVDLNRMDRQYYIN